MTKPKRKLNLSPDEIRIVHHLAKKYAKMYARKYRLGYDDLYSIAAERILTKWHDYDPEKSSRDTYFGQWIRSAFQRENILDSIIHVPVHAYVAGARVYQYDEFFNTPNDCDEDTNLRNIENRPDHHEPSADETIEKIESHAASADYVYRVAKIFNLENRWADMYIRHYRHSETLDTISKSYNLTRERIRQCIGYVARKLKLHMKLCGIKTADDMAQYVHRKQMSKSER